MRIREATKKDIGEIAKLMMGEFSKPPFEEKTIINSVIKSLTFYFKIGKSFVAIENKKIIGVVVFKIEQWWEGSVILIEDLAVEENSKKRGVGKKLTDKIEEYGKKIKASSINFATNSKSSAVKFYIKQGYKREKYRIFMKKNLK